MQRVKAKLVGAMTEMANECKRNVDEAMQQEGLAADDAKQKIAKMRVEHSAKCAKLVGTIETLEQQLLKAADEKNAQFVNGWNACESKFARIGAKTRSGAH
eukprot:220051-Pleurochrysis_carterae.AAC.1